MPARVIAVEYQDTAIRVALQTHAAEDAAVVLPDQVYYAAPVEPGTDPALIWSPQDEHALAA